MGQVRRIWRELAEYERAQGLSLRHFYKGLGREDKFGPNCMETGLYKFDLRAFQREANASAVSLGSLAPDNMREDPRI